MERGLRGARRVLYHPPGQSASVEAPGEQRNPQELSSCPYRGKQGPGVSQGPTAVTQAGTRAPILHPVWPALEAWCCKSEPMSGALGYLQVPGQGGGEGGKCHHLWYTGSGRAAPSSRVRSSRQHSMVHTDRFHGSAARSQRSHPGCPGQQLGGAGDLAPPKCCCCPVLPCPLLVLGCSVWALPAAEPSLCWCMSLCIVRAPGLSLSPSTCLCLPLKPSRSRLLHLISVTQASPRPFVICGTADLLN